MQSRLDPKGRGRIQISAELPLIYATGRRTEPPEVRFPPDTDDTTTSTHASIKTRTPAVPALPAGISLQSTCLTLLRYTNWHMVSSLSN
jgi:hypothetical protein